MGGMKYCFSQQCFCHIFTNIRSFGVMLILKHKFGRSLTHLSVFMCTAVGGCGRKPISLCKFLQDSSKSWFENLVFLSVFFCHIFTNIRLFGVLLILKHNFGTSHGHLACFHSQVGGWLGSKINITR